MRVALVATLAVLAMPALAQDVVYTGCIKSADGTLYSVRQGTTPMAPCKAKDKQISWNQAGQPGSQGPPGHSLPPSLNINVNCAEGQSINAALAQQAEKLTVSISGTCVEEVVIARDDVTLLGVDTNPTITAPAGSWWAILILGAQRVRLQGLTLTGGTFVSLGADDGASFTAYQLKISNPEGSGLSLGSGVTARMQESAISGNQGFGAGAAWGSSLILENSQVIDNGTWGLFVQTSVLTLWGATNVARNGGIGVMARNGRVVGQGGCTILDNQSGGLSLGASHLFLEQCRIAGNRSSGIGLAGSVALLSEVIIQGNEDGGAIVQLGSAIEVGSASTVEGGTERFGIYLGDTSVASVSAESSITGSPYGIMCAGPPSVAQLSGPIPATVTTNCPPQ